MRVVFGFVFRIVVYDSHRCTGVGFESLRVQRVYRASG